MERITSALLSGMANRIAYNALSTVAIAHNMPSDTVQLTSRASVQRGSASNGIAWRFQIEVFDETTPVIGRAITASSARELFNRMDAFNDALQMVKHARWDYETQQERNGETP